MTCRWARMATVDHNTGPCVHVVAPYLCLTKSPGPQLYLYVVQDQSVPRPHCHELVGLVGRSGSDEKPSPLHHALTSRLGPTSPILPSVQSYSLTVFLNLSIECAQCLRRSRKRVFCSLVPHKVRMFRTHVCLRNDIFVIQ